MKGTLTALAALAALAALPAFGQQGWYVGAGVGQGESKVFPSGIAGVAPARYDRQDAVYELRGGYRFNPAFAIEAGYYELGSYAVDVDMGSGLSRRMTARARSSALSVVAIAPWERFDIYGRVGYGRSELSTTDNGGGAQLPGLSQRGRTSEAIGAVGLRWWPMPRIGLFAEYQKHDKLEVDSWFAGLDYRF